MCLYSSRFDYCACVGDGLLKIEEQNVCKKTVITMGFKLKSLVISNKSYFDRHLNQISCYLCHKNLGLYQENVHQ